MGKKRQHKEPVIPSQDKRICGGICLCQFTIVTSCVALVYLAVAVYMPSYRAFTYGLEPVPVMCQAINSTLVNNCPWASCGEWCLTKPSGFCTQIHVTVRRNGTTITLENCKKMQMVACPMADTDNLQRYNCNNDKECATLTGIFNCSLGHCANMSELFLCHNHADGSMVDADKDNLKLKGFFECHHSKCLRYEKKLPNCDRYCGKIITTSINVYLQQGDNVYAGDCQRALAHDQTNGNEDGQKIDPTEIWREETHGILIASCHTVNIDKNGTTITATDCLNGTLVNDTDIPQPSINFTTFWSIVENSTKIMDPSLTFLPPQNHLTIYNYSKLYINLEACVNTLMGECAQFIKTHGNDGDNKTAQSRFPCYYHKNDSSLVVARFNLNKTWLELMVAIFVPSSLFIISFITLLVIGHSVHVGDDTKMRCLLCRKRKIKTQEEVDAEMDLVMEGIIEQTNAMCSSSSREDSNT